MVLGVVTPLLALLWAYRREMFPAAFKHGSMVARLSSQALGFFNRGPLAKTGSPSHQGDRPGSRGMPTKTAPLAVPTF